MLENNTYATMSHFRYFDIFGLINGAPVIISRDLLGFDNNLNYIEKYWKNMDFQNVGCFEKLMTSTLQKT